MTELAQEMDRCRPHIEAALNYSGGTHRYEHVREAILRGELQLWPGEKSAVVTEIEHYPLMKTCHLFLAGGDMPELRKMLESIEAWAKAQGCKKVTLAGRKGWLRSFLPADGYEAKFLVMSKEIA